MLEFILNEFNQEFFTFLISFVFLFLFFQLRFFHISSEGVLKYGKARKQVLCLLTAICFSTLIIMLKYLMRDSV
jgi:hypothetical protein